MTAADATTGPDPAREKERARRRRERWAIGIAAVIVVALTLIEANIAALGGSVAFFSNIVIFALINLNVVFVVLLIFLVTRNIFKLIIDRRRNILGAKIRSRLVLIFIAFSLLPTVLLFVAAANITTTSIRSWIGGRVGTALTAALEIARKDIEGQARALGTASEEAAAAVGTATIGRGAEAGLDAAAGRAGPGAALLLTTPDGRIAPLRGTFPPAVGSEIAARVKGMAAPERGAGAATMVGEAYAAAATRLPDGRAVVALKVLPEAEAHKLREIAKAYDEYHQVRLLDDPIRASYITMLVLITLLIVFAASWMGIYLARQITVPIQLLAEGTQEVAAGNLDVRLDYRSTDEFGHVVDSFNRMAADLGEMKRHLTEANVSLSTTYEELKARTQLIEAILTNISTGIVFVDRAGRIEMINTVAARMLGIEAADAVGKPYKDVVRVEHYEAVRSLRREMGDGGATKVERQLTLPIRDKETSVRVSLTALPGDAGEYRGVVVAFDDLSQALRLQKVLAWREVARRIAHEIRNPLQPIQLSAERLQRKYASDHAGEPAFTECTQTILYEVGTLKNLVGEFTRFARMPAPVLKEGSLADVLRPVVETYREKHPAIAWEFVSADVPPVWFDPFQIHRAVTNLLENAAAALGGGGRVVVRCALETELGLVRISVADDGPGIAPEDRDRLFEPYFSRKEGGTGLGLAIVSAIADDHAGTVRVRDNVPRGSVFEIEFPASPGGKGADA